MEDLMSNLIRFSYWSDPLCIWAYVAQRCHERVLREYQGRIEVDYHVVPVFGSIPWRFRHGPWADQGYSGRADRTREIALQHGRPEVTGAVWRDDPPASSWAPGAAIKAVFAQADSGSLSRETAVQFQEKMRQAFFVENLNIARRAVQLQLAESLAIPRDFLEGQLDDGSALALLWEDHIQREALHIQGSPTYVFDGGRAQLYGNFSVGILLATVEQLVSGGPAGASAC